MTKHFELEIEKLKNKVLTLGSKVEESLSLAVNSILNRQLLAPADIKARDRVIDQIEVEIEEDCLKVLALHQPVASDLRFIVAVLKLNNDLERIGDLAVSIAFRAKPLVETQPALDLFNLQTMAEKSQAMLHRALEALINLDLALANKVCADDDEIDKLNADIFKLIEQAFRADSSKAKQLMQLFAVSRNLERIADHSTNIAEDVVYLIQGEIIRHSRAS